MATSPEPWLQIFSLCYINTNSLQCNLVSILHYAYFAFCGPGLQNSGLSEPQQFGARDQEIQHFIQRKSIQKKVIFSRSWPKSKSIDASLFSYLGWTGTTVWYWIGKCTFLPIWAFISGLLMVCKQVNLKKEHNFPFIFPFWFHMPQMETIWWGLKRWEGSTTCSSASPLSRAVSNVLLNILSQNFPSVSPRSLL
jgi:hypothetical protein